MRIHHRRVYFAELVDGTLSPSSGCWVTDVDTDGNRLEQWRDPRASLFANIGDRLIVAAADLEKDDLAAVEVTGVHRDGRRLAIEVHLGAVEDGRVSVMKLARRAA